MKTLFLSDGARRLLRRWGCIPLFALVTLLMTFPLVLNLGTALDYYGDTLYDIWLLGRDGTRLLTDPTRLTEPDILYPHKDSYWMGNHCYVPSILFAVFWRVTDNPVFANNVLYLVGITLNACAAYWLSLAIWGAPFAALISGIAYGYCPFAFSGYGTVLFQTFFWLPLALLALRGFLLGKGWGYGCAFLVFCALQFFTALEYGLALLLATAILVILTILLEKSSRELLFRKARFLSLGLLAVIAVTLLSNWPLLKTSGSRVGEGRTFAEVQEGSADLKNYFAPTPGNILFGKIAKSLYRNPCWFNSPGYLAWILIVLVFVVRFGRFYRRRGGSSDRLPAGELGIWGILTVVMISISMGPRLRAFGYDIGPGPYLVTVRLIPGLNKIRVLWPFVRLAVLGLCVLAGGGASWLACKAIRGSRVARIVCIILPVAMLLEYAQGPTMGGAPYYRPSIEPPPLYRWLAEQGGRFPILELPMPSDPGEPTPIGNELSYMYWQLFHEKILVNGICAFYPPDYRLLAEVMASFPSPESLAALTLYKPRYVIVHFDYYPIEVARTMRQRIMRQSRWLRIVKKFPNAWVVELTTEDLPDVVNRSNSGNLRDLPCSDWKAAASRNGADALLAFDRDFETCWTTASAQRKGDFFELQLPKTARIARIDLYFKLQGEFADYPRGLCIKVSEDGETWREAAFDFSYYRILKDLLNGSETVRMTIDIEPVSARFVKLMITADFLAPPWTISELFIFEQMPEL